MKDYTELGKIVLEAYGTEACLSGYLTDDPFWVGQYALQYGDIEKDGTLT